MTGSIDAVFKDIDAANSADPRTEFADGAGWPVELLYSQRMSACLDALYPGASAALKIAARGQHIGRWQIPRTSYPLGRAGYHAWRNACREHHAALVASIMERHGFGATDRAQAGKIIRKDQLKSDPEVQALENVVGVVFARYYLADFVRKNHGAGTAKIVEILRKTIRKMDAIGVAALGCLTLPDDLKQTLAAALGGESEPDGSD